MAPSITVVDVKPEASGDVRGRRVAVARSRPTTEEAPIVACSFEHPVCVHAGPRVPGGDILAVLKEAERALSGYQSLGLPSPLPDGNLGGSSAYDLYVIPGADRLTTTADLTVGPDRWDRASAFTVLPPPAQAAGCDTGFAIAQAIAHAMGLSFDAGAEDSAMSMEGSYLASLVAECGPTELLAIDDFQRHPERSFVNGDRDRTDGALLFPWFLDDVYAKQGPGAVMLGLVALATQRTPSGSWEWVNEPDIFDVLRATTKARGSTLDSLLLEFAVARAFIGSRSDGRHLSDAAKFGDLGRVRFEWAVPYDSLPRRLAPAAPIEAMGMTYLWVDLSSAHEGNELTFIADWELPSLFRWSLVKIDKTGTETSRVEVAGLFGSNHAERTVVGLEGLAGVLVVGMNTGSVDRGHPFDPDEQPLMPHSYTVTLAQ